MNKPHWKELRDQHQVFALVKEIKVKVKAKVSLSTIRRHMGEVQVYLHSFLTSAPDGGEWSTSCHSRFVPRGKCARCPLNRKFGDIRYILVVPDLREKLLPLYLARCLLRVYVYQVTQCQNRGCQYMITIHLKTSIICSKNGVSFVYL
jgi:hypothetical protein